ncbi:hypothetical protein PsWM33_00641 [Pseudovibrio sp. WM33]|nr:hypothetical protein PsWM33_00641 [Pseudovibrio sp. WM33]
MQLLRLICNKEFCFINLNEVIKIEPTYQDVEMSVIHTTDGKQTTVREHVGDILEQIKLFMEDKV